MPHRKTFIAHGRFAMRAIRLRAARAGEHGTQVITFEHLAAETSRRIRQAN